MSNTISSIPASKFVTIIPSVVSGGGTALDLIGLMLTTSTRVPIGTVESFPNLTAIGNYFGATSNEQAEGAVYFAGIAGATALPGALLVAQYPTASVGAYLRGGNVANLTLTQLQALSGVLTVTINGTVDSSSTISLAGATSFSSAAQIITSDLGVSGAIQASVTASIGATFTGSAGSPATNIVASSVTGTISIGDTIAGTGVPLGTTLLSQIAGTIGGAGTYSTSGTITSSSNSIIDSSSTMYVTHVASGVVANGQQLVGAGVTAGTFITTGGTGAGGTGTYVVTQVQQVASESMTLENPTVTYDSLSGGFLVVSPTVGAASTIGFASGSISTSLALTQAAGATISQGATAAVPATFMNAIVAQTEDWCTFWTSFDPDGGSGNAQKLAFAAWNNTQGNGYLYAAQDTDITPTANAPAPTSLGYLVKVTYGYSGTAAVYAPTSVGYHLGAYVAGYVAGLDYNATNGRTTAAFTNQSGIVPSVTNLLIANNLDTNGYSYYAGAATRSQPFDFFYDGQVSGPFAWIDSYVNSIQLNAAMQEALMAFVTQVKSIPYNAAGYASIRQTLAGGAVQPIQLPPASPIAAALNFGTIRTGVPLSAAQASVVNAAAGLPIDGILTSQGWYLQILPATAQVRANRQTPPITLWYTDGQSVQQITMGSVLIQ